MERGEHEGREKGEGKTFEKRPRSADICTSFHGYVTSLPHIPCQTKIFASPSPRTGVSFAEHVSVKRNPFCAFLSFSEGEPLPIPPSGQKQTPCKYVWEEEEVREGGRGRTNDVYANCGGLAWPGLVRIPDGKARWEGKVMGKKFPSPSTPIPFFARTHFLHLSLPWGRFRQLYVNARTLVSNFPLFRFQCNGASNLWSIHTCRWNPKKLMANAALYISAWAFSSCLSSPLPISLPVRSIRTLCSEREERRGRIYVSTGPISPFPPFSSSFPFVR